MKKHITKRVLALLLCGALFCISPVGTLAVEIEKGDVGELDDAITVDAQPTSLSRADEAQTIVVNIEFSQTVVINAISAAEVLLPDGWQISVRGVGYTLESGDTEDHLLSIGYDSSVNMIAGAYSDDESYRHIHGIRLTYTLPAGVVGAFSLGLEDLWLGTVYGVMVIDGVDVTTSISVSDPGSPVSSSGDINLDGKINNRDVITLFRYAAGQYNELKAKEYDLNKDGTFDVQDAHFLFRKVSGWNSPIPQ